MAGNVQLATYNNNQSGGRRLLRNGPSDQTAAINTTNTNNSTIERVIHQNERPKLINNTISECFSI